MTGDGNYIVSMPNPTNGTLPDEVRDAVFDDDGNLWTSQNHTERDPFDLKPLWAKSYIHKMASDFSYNVFAQTIPLPENSLVQAFTFRYGKFAAILNDLTSDGGNAAATSSYRVVEIDIESGEVTDIVTGGFTQPQDIVCDASGNLYISDDEKHQILKIPYGETTPSVLAEDVYYPWGLTFDYNGNLYAGHYTSETSSIVRFNASVGNTLSIYNIPTTSSAIFGEAGADAFVKITAGDRTVVVKADGEGRWNAASRIQGEDTGPFAFTEGEVVSAETVSDASGATPVSGKVQATVGSSN